MISRRTFLGHAGAALIAVGAQLPRPRPRATQVATPPLLISNGAKIDIHKYTVDHPLARPLIYNGVEVEVHQYAVDRHPIYADDGQLLGDRETYQVRGLYCARTPGILAEARRRLMMRGHSLTLPPHGFVPSVRPIHVQSTVVGAGVVLVDLVFESL